MVYLRVLAGLIVIGLAAYCSAADQYDTFMGVECEDVADSVSLLQYSTKASIPEVAQQKESAIAEEDGAAPVEEVLSSELTISDIPKFVISTAQYGKRALPLVQELQKYGQAFKNSCRVQAVVGSKCTGFWHGKLELGPAGVSTSHMKIWQHIVDKQIPVAMVMEDDALGLTPPNLLSLVQAALDRHRNYDLFRIAQIPVPPHWYLQDKVNPGIVEHQSKKCRGFYGEQMYIMTLAGAKFALANFQYGTGPYALDVYKDVYNNSAYTNLDSYKIECYARPMMRFMIDEEGDFSDWEIHDKSKVHSERIHPDLITTISTLSSESKQLIQDVLPDCPTDGMLMEPCANYKEGVWTVSEKSG